MNDQIEDSTKNYYKKAPELLGTKELVVNTGEKEVKVVIENDKVVRVDDDENEYSLDNLNSQLQAGATLGEALVGSINALNEMSRPNGKRIGYIVTKPEGRKSKLKMPNSSQLFFLFSKLPDHKALDAAIEQAGIYNGRVREIIQTESGKHEYGEIVWDSEESGGLQESKIRSLIRECIREVIQELK